MMKAQHSTADEMDVQIPDDWSRWEPPETRTMGMKVTLGLESTAEEAIAEARIHAEEQGVPIDDATVEAVDGGYETRREEFDEWHAADVRGFLFPTVYRYDRHQGERTKFTGKVWLVRWQTAEVDR